MQRNETAKRSEQLRMAHVLIVLAHHETKSFNHAMTRVAVDALVSNGHRVQLSDLYAIGFDPISDRRNFTGVANAASFDQQAEERHASGTGGFSPDLQREMDKLAWCDTLILQFPIWWLGMPAILKGWIDRVFAVGRAYGGGKWFDRGALSDKRAMLSVTMGGREPAYSDDGIYGPCEAILRPINHGILGFVGFTVIEPFVVFGPGRMDEAERRDALLAYRQRILSLDHAPVFPSVHADDYENFVLKRAQTLIV